MDEGCVPARQQKENKAEDTHPGKVRLAETLPWQSMSAYPLLLHRVEEPKIYNTDDRPINESGDRYQILEPTKHRRSCARKSHVSKADEEREESHCDPRNAETTGSLEHCWSPSFSGEAIEHPRAVEESRIAGTPSTAKHNGIDNARHDFYSCARGSNDEW